MLGCAIVDASGEALAVTGDPARWAGAVQDLISAADGAGDEPVDHLHIATEDGEVFAVRGRELTLAATTARFVLASLMVFDMRTVLRELES